MSASPSFHETLHRDRAERAGSDRAFGLVVGAVALVVALAPLVRGGGVRRWALGVGVALLVAALARPAWLAPLNRAWMRLGRLLNRVTSPALLGAVYYGVLTPLGLLRRRRSRDPMHLRFDRDAPSYWVPRPPAAPRSSMRDQF
jgi:hypothetical protein